MKTKHLTVYVAVALLAVSILSLWLWWESYSDTVIWELRDLAFPMPFYLTWFPHWFVVDLAISINIVVSLALTYLVIKLDLSRKG